MAERQSHTHLAGSDRFDFGKQPLNDLLDEKEHLVIDLEEAREFEASARAEWEEAGQEVDRLERRMDELDWWIEDKTS